MTDREMWAGEPPRDVWVTLRVDGDRVTRVEAKATEPVTVEFTEKAPGTGDDA